MPPVEDVHSCAERLVSNQSVIRTTHKIQCPEGVDGFSGHTHQGGPSGSIEHGMLTI